MWNIPRFSTRPDTELVQAASELLEGTLRTLIVAIGAMCGLSFVTATFVAPDSVAMRLGFFVLPVVVALSAIAYHLVSRQFAIAHALWQAGLLIAVALSVALFGLPEAALLLARQRSSSSASRYPSPTTRGGPCCLTSTSGTSPWVAFYSAPLPGPRHCRSTRSPGGP